MKLFSVIVLYMMRSHNTFYFYCLFNNFFIQN